MDLVFSDIHADINALETILGVASSSEFTKKYGAFSRIINLGDVLERGTRPKEVLSRLKSLEKNYPFFSVMGNHDEGFLYNRLVSESSIESMDAHAKLNSEDISFFKENNDGTFGNQEFIDRKYGLFCVHGGPLDPKNITPKNAQDESWLYQRSWQRLTDENFEFFTYAGYHYKASSAFEEAKRHVRNHIILCGHQHQEEVIMQDGNIQRLYPALKPIKEKIPGHILERKEIEINPDGNYLIRLGIGGPQGHYVKDSEVPHFAVIQHDPRKVILFTILPGMS
ncbi:MAG: metallophosphoesterase [Thaumarchaeota archaeon]|nr:metallophosphoesterase [Nitrososphaerota archaeon]